MKRGLALEGGGARGSYHIGVFKAFLENGYEFDGFVGTSIGAINSAILAQGDFELAYDLWHKISPEQLFHDEDQRLVSFSDVKLTKDTALNLGRSIKRVISTGGFDTTKMKQFLAEYLDEEKIRNSGKDFGLVTYSVDERKAYEIHLEDIAEGKLINYIMASAALPFFKSEIIDEKKFIDGGFYNNCPLNLLVDKNYDEIIAVRTGSIGIFRKKKCRADVMVIEPSDDLGEFLSFTAEDAKFGIELGYYDGLRAIKNLRGRRYYLEAPELEEMEQNLVKIETAFLEELCDLLDLKKLPPRRAFFEEIIPQIGSYLDLKKDFDYGDFIIALLELAASKKGLPRFQLYDVPFFIERLKNTPQIEVEESLIGRMIHKISKKAIVTEKLIDYLLEKM